MIGHSPLMTPKAIHKEKPTTVTVYIGAEMLLVSFVLMIFQACGVKLVIEHIAAKIAYDGRCVHFRHLSN